MIIFQTISFPIYEPSLLKVRQQTNGPVTLDERRRMLDPILWRQRPWVIIDPADPEEVLYLREREYHSYWKITTSNAMELTIIARPTTSPDLIGPIENKAGDPKTTSDSTTDPNFPKPRSYHTFSFKNSPISLKKIIGLFSGVGTESQLVDLDDSNVIQFILKYVRQTYFWVYGELNANQILVGAKIAKRYRTILKDHGIMGLILRFKVSLIVINSFVGGKPRRNTRDLGYYVKLTNGLPSDLPKEVRSRIRSGDLSVIRIWGSIFNMYKVLKGTNLKVDFTTVQSPKLQTPIDNLSYIMAAFFKCCTFIPKSLLNVSEQFRLISIDFKPVCSSNAGPNASPAFKGPIMDLLAWLHHPKGLSYLKYFLYSKGGIFTYDPFKMIRDELVQALDYISNSIPESLDVYFERYIFPFNDPKVGTFDLYLANAKQRFPKYVYFGYRTFRDPVQQARFEASLVRPDERTKKALFNSYLKAKNSFQIVEKKTKYRTLFYAMTEPWARARVIRVSLPDKILVLSKLYGAKIIDFPFILGKLSII